MAESSLRSRLNMHGIVDLDQMAAVLTALVDQVDKQNKVIGDLQKSLSLYVKNDVFVDRLNSLEGVVATAITRIDAIQEAATATVTNKKISAGHLASANFKQIGHLMKLVNECATKLELEVQKKELSGVQFNLETLRVDFNHSLGVIDELSNSQCHQSNRITVLEGSVAGKLDRSECDHLQSLVAKVLLYDGFKTDTTEAVKQLQAFRSMSLNRYDTYDEHLCSLDGDLQQLQRALSLTATRKEVHQLGKEIVAVETRLDTCASADTVSQIQRELNGAQADIAQSSRRIDRADTRAGELGVELATKASLQALRECVTRRHYEQAVSALGAAVEQKAAQHSLDTVQSKLQDLEHQVGLESGRLAVAMRFVDWFTSRGENYEHNMKIIDKHLKGLVVSGGGVGPGVLGAAGDGAALATGSGLSYVSSSASSSSVHAYYSPGNRVAFQASPEHAR